MTFQNMNQRGVSSSSQFSNDISFRPKRTVGVWKPKHTNDQHSQGEKPINVASTSDGLTENNIVTNAAPCESSLFSSSLSGIFTEKLRLLEKDVSSSSKPTIVGSVPEMDADALAKKRHTHRTVRVWKPKHTNDQHSQGTSGVVALHSSTSNAASTSDDLTENNIVTNAAPCESSLFSSSMSGIFTEKLRLLDKDVPSSSKSIIVGSIPEEKPYKSLEEMDVDTLANLLPDEDELFSDLFDGFGYNSHAIKNGESEDFDVFSNGGGMELEGNENSTSVNRTTGVDRDSGGGSKGKLPFVSSTLFVRNIDGNVRNYELKALFEQCGKIRYTYTGCKHRGFVMVSYYDIKTAQHAMKTLQSTLLRSRKLDIHYSYPKGNNAREAFSPTFHPHSLPQYHGSSAKAKGNFSSTAINNKTVNIGTRGTCDGRHIQGKSSTGNVAESNGGGLPNNGVYRTWNNSNMHQQSSSFPRSNLSSNTWKSSTKPLQLGQILHGRPPITSMSKFDKEQYELDLASILCGVDRRTTLMIRNIPNKYTSRMLIDAIDAQCRGTYDFLYLPIDFKYKCNVGYAFINMIDPIEIIPFYQAINGKKWEKFHSKKLASLSYARIQGRDSLVAHFQNSSVIKEEDKGRRPILFHAHGTNVGDMEPFPISDEVRLRNKKPYLLGSRNMENHGQESSST